MNFWFKSLQNRMHLGQNVSEVLKIMPRKHSEIRFHQNWPLNSIDVTFLCEQKRRVLMNYFQAHPRAGGVSEAASERADPGQTRAEGTGALTETSIFPGPEEQRGPSRQSRGRKAKLCPPEEQGLPSPHLKGSHKPHREHRAGTTLLGGSKEQWQHLFRLPLLLILHFSVLPDGFALLN